MLFYTIDYNRKRRTLCLGESLTMFPLWNHVIFGVGSAVMRHSNNNRLPSSSCLIAGFFAKVGAIPSICLQAQNKRHMSLEIYPRKFIVR